VTNEARGKAGKRASKKPQSGSVEAQPRQPLTDTSSRDIYRVVIIACIAMAAGMACSRPLWISADRLYPPVPILNVSTTSFALSAVLLSALLVALVVSALPKVPVWCRVVPVGIIAVLVALDQSRFQPWIFMYAVILLVAAFASRIEGRNAGILMTLRFMLAAQYFWSGLQKANDSFIEQVWPTFADPLFGALHLPLSAGHAAGFVVPLLEVAVGCCLFVPRTRRIGVIGACVTHATILASLLASGEKHRRLGLERRNASVRLRAVLERDERPVDCLVNSEISAGHCVRLVGRVLPALSFVGYWDSYPSWALYSGNTAQAVVVIDPAALNTLPDVLRRKYVAAIASDVHRPQSVVV